MAEHIHRLVVVPGYKCNFSCTHCATANKKNRILSSKEIGAILKAVEKHSIRSFLFVGGEPTLYIDDINHILSRLKDLNESEIRITTNGHFARTKAFALKILTSFLRLNNVQLSYDNFHRKFLPFGNVKNLYLACNQRKVEFNVAFAMESPLDLTLLPRLRKVGNFPIVIQRVLPIGAARVNDIRFKDFVSEKKVLSSRCPSRHEMVYLCGQGFTSCCATLTFNTDSTRFTHQTPEQHRKSAFYKLISACTFSEIRKRFGLAEKPLLPSQMNSCAICEHLFVEKYKNRL